MNRRMKRPGGTRVAQAMSTVPGAGGALLWRIPEGGGTSTALLGSCSPVPGGAGDTGWGAPRSAGGGGCPSFRSFSAEKNGSGGGKGAGPHPSLAPPLRRHRRRLYKPAAPVPPAPRRPLAPGAMFAVKPKAVIGFNLYCGGSPGLGPAGPGQRPEPAAAAASEQPRERSGAAAGRADPPRALIGRGAAPRALIGCGATLWRPEEELDGCEPEPERGPAADSLPGTPPGPPDGLRQESLELIGRYLREVAGEAQPSAKKLFPGLLGGPGRPGAAGDAVMEKALETLRRVGDGVMRKHELAFQGGCRPEPPSGSLGRVTEPGAARFGDGGDALVAALAAGPGSRPGHSRDVASARSGLNKAAGQRSKTKLNFVPLGRGKAAVGVCRGDNLVTD